MALLTIGVALTLPALGNFFRGRAVDDEARRLLALTRFGQSRAVTEGMPMLLWFDVNEQRYGLSIDTTFAEYDRDAREYRLPEELHLEIMDSRARTPPGNSLAIAPSQPGQRRSIAGLPVIRFLPDGYISLTSPRSVRVYRDPDPQAAVADPGLWLVQTTNRLSYELRRTEPDARDLYRN